MNHPTSPNHQPDRSADDVVPHRTVPFGVRSIGNHAPPLVVAEIGINHNGSVEQAEALIDMAASCGCDAVKFQKRDPDLCVPAAMAYLSRSTPWGTLSYLDYRKRIELDSIAYERISKHADKVGIPWFASAWDWRSVDFLATFAPPAIKVASACVTDDRLLDQLSRHGLTVMLSTGMSTLEQIDHAVERLSGCPVMLFQCTSSYPCADQDIHLRAIRTLAERYRCPIGYSGHERDLLPSLLAIAAGACAIERHVTLDRGAWGSDHGISLEAAELEQLVVSVRRAWACMGDGEKRVLACEREARRRLRIASPVEG